MGIAMAGICIDFFNHKGGGGVVGNEQVIPPEEKENARISAQSWPASYFDTNCLYCTLTLLTLTFILGVSLFCYYNFFSEKGFRFWSKKNPSRALVGTIGLHSNSGTSFMSMVIKGMVRITNEDRQLLSSLAILIIPLTVRLIKEIPGLECRPIVPTKARKDFFWPKSETFF